LERVIAFDKRKNKQNLRRQPVNAFAADFYIINEGAPRRQRKTPVFSFFSSFFQKFFDKTPLDWKTR